MTFIDLMGEVGKQLGVALEVVEGCVNLSLDDMTVSILEMSELELVVLSGELCEPPPQGLEQLYGALLEANHNFLGTAGATLSKNPENGKFTLTRGVSTRDLDAEKFLATLENFANTMETWRKVITDYRPVADDAAATEMPALGGGFIQV